MNKVEILRSICFTKEDLNNIQNLGDTLPEKDIEFMIEFKKIYELGLNQLQKFLDKLEEEGKDLDEYTIQYYVDILTNGPLGTYAKKLTENNKYFIKSPECMGQSGNVSRGPANSSLIYDSEKPLGFAVDVYNHVPEFIQKTLKQAVDQTEKVFRTGMNFSTVNDNTLPIIDKAPQQRYNDEPKGLWTSKSNGSYCVKDVYYYYAVQDISQSLFEKVKEYLGEEDFRMWAVKKSFRPFDSEKNPDKAVVNEIVRKVGEEELTLDIHGEPFESDERRAVSLKINNDDKDVEYILNSNIGQLGS